MFWPTTPDRQPCLTVYESICSRTEIFFVNIFCILQEPRPFAYLVVPIFAPKGGIYLGPGVGFCTPQAVCSIFCTSSYCQKVTFWAFGFPSWRDVSNFQASNCARACMLRFILLVSLLSLKGLSDLLTSLRKRQPFWRAKRVFLFRHRSLRRVDLSPAAGGGTIAA